MTTGSVLKVTVTVVMTAMTVVLIAAVTCGQKETERQLDKTKETKDNNGGNDGSNQNVMTGMKIQ
jgi:hypothetical protein